MKLYKPLVLPHYRQLSSMISSASIAGESPAQRGTSGNISSIFAQKTRDKAHPRFSALKKALWQDSMLQSWAQVLDALKEKVEQVGSLGSKVDDSIKLTFICAKTVHIVGDPGGSLRRTAERPIRRADRRNQRGRRCDRSRRRPERCLPLQLYLKRYLCRCRCVGGSRLEAIYKGLHSRKPR